MNKLDRKYVTLNAVNGNIDAYCSVSFDFTGVKEKVSLSVNGESCETQSFYVVVKEGTNFLAFYLGDLNKKAENKYEFKKEGCKLGSTIYTLKDVVAVQIVDNIYKQVLYHGIVDENAGYKGTYTIVVDKPVVVRLEAEPQRGVNNNEDKKDVDKLDTGDMVNERIELDELDELEVNVREELEELEENVREEVEGSEENAREEVEELEENVRGELEAVEENARGEELEAVEENVRGVNELEQVEESIRDENELKQAHDSIREQNQLDNKSDNLIKDDLINSADIVDYDRGLNERINAIINSKTTFEDVVDVEQCEMDCTSQDVADAKCNSCEYKLFFNEYERQVKEVNDDFQVFNELYGRYLRNEFNNNYSNVNLDVEQDYNIEEKNDLVNINEVDDSKFNRNIEFKNYQNFVEFERLRPNTQARESDTKVINATFRSSVDKDNQEQNGNSNDFYKQLIGDNKNKNGDKKKNKNTSFVDIFNYVKQEFDSIKEIMSLSDDEFAKRSEQEFKTENNEKNLGTNNSGSNRARDLNRITTLRSLIEQREEFKQFEMENHCVKWVQIKLNEVVGFFDNHWKLFWEPFVVDAYTKNKHLLLGVEEIDGKEVYLFAVPTVYNKENTDKAYELGFEFFEVVGDNFGEITDGANGYFIKELKQDGDTEKDIEKDMSNKEGTYTYGTKTNGKTDVSINGKDKEETPVNANEQMNINNTENNNTANDNVGYENLDDVQSENMDLNSESNTNSTNEYNIKVGKNIDSNVDMQ